MCLGIPITLSLNPSFFFACFEVYKQVYLLALGRFELSWVPTCSLLLVWVSWRWSCDWAHVALKLLPKVGLKVLRLVARLSWRVVLLRFLHEMLLVWLVS